MKNKFLLTSLVFSLLLTGCFGKDEGVPTKTKYSNEVTYEVFKEKLDNTLGDAMNLDAGVSYTAISKLTNNTKINLFDKDDVEVGNLNSKIAYDYNGKYDNDTDVSVLSVSGSRKTVSVINGEKNSDSDKANFSRVYQPSIDHQSEAEKKTISVNRRDKEYYVMGEYSSNEPAGQPVKLFALPILFFAFGTANFDSKSDDEKAKWKFYIDSGVYTAVYTNETSETKTEYVDDHNVEYATVEKSERDLIQLKGKKANGKMDNLSCYFEMVSNETTNYLVDHVDDDFQFTAGQKLVEKSSLSIGLKMDAANVSLTAIDLTDYTLKETDTESEEHEIFKF